MFQRSFRTNEIVAYVLFGWISFSCHESLSKSGTKPKLKVIWKCNRLFAAGQSRGTKTHWDETNCFHSTFLAPQHGVPNMAVLYHT